MNSARTLGAWLAICPGILAQAPHVTDTKLVHEGKVEQLLRKINGRWWSQDNREVYPPEKDGMFWRLDSKPGVCQFFHHRPFQLELAESLRLWMTPQEVETAVGPPNRIFGTRDHGFWYYYASNGIKLQVRFMGEGALGEAKYYSIDEKSRPVAAIERDLNGRDIYKLLQERASNRSNEWLGRKMDESRTAQAARSEALRNGVRPGRAQPRTVALESITVPPAAEPQPSAQTRVVSLETLTAITIGTTRDDVLSRLGEPKSRFAITSDEGSRESLTYDLDSGEAVVIRLLDGKVAKVR